MNRCIPASADHTGFVIVRLSSEDRPSDSKTLPSDSKTLADHAKRNGLAGIAGVLAKLGNPKSERLVTAIPAAKLLEMERRAAQTEFPPLRSLTRYWRVDLRESEPELLDRALALLRRAPDVEMVEEEELARPALVNPLDDPFSGQQGYLTPAPVGIDAQWMWNTAGAEGAGVGVVDIEGGWQLTHEDFTGRVSPPIFGQVNTASGWLNHGTAVLGVIAAADSTFGVVGIAPAMTSIRVSSIYVGGVQQTANAFAAAIGAMTVGEIMLIELQTGSALLPMETSDPLLDLIRLATSQGILVVEAGGNGSNDLDAWIGSSGDRLDRTSPNFVDSGALMVGASLSTVPHDTASFSNYGNRIDCYAWGYDVATCGYGNLSNLGPDKTYTSSFSGTSSASPIIVGAAALVQSYYMATEQTPMSPTQLRTLLSNPATGTPQGAGGAIGVMPNLAAIVPALGLLPDVYLRDAVGDTGLVPWTGGLCASPDIIVRDAAVTNPSQVFGVGTENMWALGDVAEFGQPNYVYVRVHNRGGTSAANVKATVYWADPATLVTPSMWNLVGSVTIPVVPIGNVITVSGGITWSTVPAPGHYCFVATLDHPKDPTPIDPLNFPAMTAADFQDLIRNQNNVTWRNFNVVNALPPSAGTSFPFLMTGADAGPEPFAVEIERRLPRDARLILEGPAALILQLRGAGREVLIGRDGSAQLVLPSLPRIALGEVRLGGRIRYRCKLTLVEGKEKIGWGHGAALRQLYRGDEIGAVEWRFAPRAGLCPDEKKGGPPTKC